MRSSQRRAALSLLHVTRLAPSGPIWQAAYPPDSTRAISLITVVFPTPGRPRNSTELGTAAAGMVVGGCGRRCEGAGGGEARHPCLHLPLPSIGASTAEQAIQEQPCNCSTASQLSHPPSRMSRIMSMWPVTARPTRHVSPTTTPLRLRIAASSFSGVWAEGQGSQQGGGVHGSVETSASCLDPLRLAHASRHPQPPHSNPT